MTLTTCPHCDVRVIPSAAGMCPSCRRPLQVSAECRDVAATATNPYESPTAAQTDDGLDQQKLIRRGGWLFICIVGINILPLLWSAVSNQPTGNPTLEIFFSVALLYFLWRGQAWAKWITVALFILLAALMIIAGLLKGNAPFLIGGGVLASVPALLLFS